MNKLFNNTGSLKIIKQRGQLNITSHPSALSALERKALQYLAKNISQDGQDNKLITSTLEQKEGDEA